MKNKHFANTTHGNFWTGFGLGSALALVALYAFGTKKGRNNLQKIINISENWEDHLETITREVETVINNRKHNVQGENSNFIGQLLNKIKSKSN